MDIGLNRYKQGELLYANKLESPADVEDFRMEGPGVLSFPNGAMRMESRLDPSAGQNANFVLWCPVEFPDSFVIRWDFRPIREPGLCMLFFAAAGGAGEDLFDPGLALRSGPYNQYHSGDINAYHIAYFRRALPDERALHVCNLRKSRGMHLVAQGADPIPGVAEVRSTYRIELVKTGGDIRFMIQGLPVLNWIDDGETLGPVLGPGRIGFRQLVPLIAEYANLEVYALEPAGG
ncbi:MULTISPECIES: YesU family protein [Paenibacillus]|uniref:YesU family protein n=1 Tax=Paenibacillus TaxID=44249 RepID=UPI0022B897D3|nr:YesU family protein [Paenibacillus caseinilyticus]MCZ8522519.1 YesU family protein [Paenibacillus caseinilyticus]